MRKHKNFGRRKLHCIVNYNEYLDLCKAQGELWDAADKHCIDKIMSEIEFAIEKTIECVFGLKYDVYFYLADEKELEEVF